MAKSKPIFFHFCHALGKVQSELQPALMKGK